MNNERSANNEIFIAVIILIAVGIIIAVVTSVVLPIFGRTHCPPRRPSCIGNLKELGTALALYQGDYDAKLPSSMLYSSSKNWDEQAFENFASKRGMLPPPLNMGVGAIPETWAMALYPHMMSKEIIWCPSDPNRSDHPQAIVSYYWKAAVDRAWYGGYQKEGSFDFPADQIIFYEHNDLHLGDANKGLVDGVRINVCYLDGHVATIKIANSGYTAAENPPSPLPKSGIGEPAWFNYSYGAKTPKDNKGRNWNPQMYGDKLP